MCRAFGTTEPEWLVAMFAEELLSVQTTTLQTATLQTAIPQTAPLQTTTTRPPAPLQIHQGD